MKGESKMKIMTFNTQHCLNHLEKRIDFDIMARAIKTCGADVVGLNEMRGEGEDKDYTDQVKILSELAEMPYYSFAPAIYVRNKGLYGNGFLSRIPILSVENIPIPDPVREKDKSGYESRCLLKVRLQGDITVIVTHFGLNKSEQANAVAAVTEHITDTKCILMGDFNVTPDDPVLLPIRKRMTDASAAFDAPKLSFPSDAPRLKIDYIFLSKDVELETADIPSIVASDHLPHTATVKL